MKRQTGASQGGNTMTHTPGPWRIEYTGAFPMIVSRDGGKFDGACICSEVCNGNANARLIAAAPELLEACKWMLDWIEEYKSYISDGPIGDNEAYTKAQAAIAKAEGRE